MWPLCLRVETLSLALLSVAMLGHAADASKLLSQLGTTMGICVVVTSETNDIPLELAAGSELIIYVQSSDTEVVTSLQQAAAARGQLGTRIYVERGQTTHLHTADNLADGAIVLGEALTDELRAELLRVTHPGASILTPTDTFTNPRPEGSDDWSHPYHGPDNNPQSQDQHSQGPYLTQFLAEPWYVPMPQVTVASGGRVFKAFGHIALKEREWPWLNKLVAINGYNGTMLWERPLPEGYLVHRSAFIASADTFFMIDGESCLMLDAATGKEQGRIRIPGVPGDWKWMASRMVSSLCSREDRNRKLKQPKAIARWEDGVGLTLVKGTTANASLSDLAMCWLPTVCKTKSGCGFIVRIH